jgi:hypothetical protein
MTNALVMYYQVHGMDNVDHNSKEGFLWIRIKVWVGLYIVDIFYIIL